MGFSFWDFMQIAAPIAATAVAGPVGGIIASGAMGAGTGIAKGEGVKGALLRGGLGAGSGALTAGALGSLSKGAEGAAANAVTKAAAKKGLEATAAEGALKLGAYGQPLLSEGGFKAAQGALEAGTGMSNALQRFADVTSKARGKNPDETAGMLKTVAGGANALGKVASLFEPEEQARFSQVQGMTGMPGMSPMYQYGYGGYGSGVTSSTGRRFY